jgi:putative nucleotidyltransferase with HDIG domain
MTASQMLAKVRTLPPISNAALELGRLLGRVDSSNEDVVRILKQDPVLTAKLLRACNSSALGLKQRIASVDQALLILGHGQVFQMVTALAFRDPLAAPLPAYGLQNNDLWRHCLLSAKAGEIAVADGLDVGIDRSMAFTIGLLHDLGKLITGEFLTRQALIAIREHVVEGYPPVQAEREVLGTDHAEVGATLLYLWRLPEPLIEAISLHHQPVLQPEPRPSALAWLADRLAHLATASESLQRVPPLGDAAKNFAALGCATENLESLLARIREPSAVADESLVLTS